MLSARHCHEKIRRVVGNCTKYQDLIMPQGSLQVVVWAKCWVLNLWEAQKPDRPEIISSTSTFHVYLIPFAGKTAGGRDSNTRITFCLFLRKTCKKIILWKNDTVTWCLWMKTSLFIGYGHLIRHNARSQFKEGITPLNGFWMTVSF